MPETGHAGWLDILAAMEADLEACSLLAALPDGGSVPVHAGIGPTWAAPDNLGPLPAELADRARRLLAAQQDLTRRLQQLQHTTVRHLAAVRSVPDTRATGQSVYLDVTG